jgi:hypothetical protein
MQRLRSAKTANHSAIPVPSAPVGSRKVPLHEVETVQDRGKVAPGFVA